jgi:signal transduction histidine kinase
VADNGAGFDLLSRPPGMGLRSIRERVESIGGIMSLESCTGEGTCLTVRVPLKGSLE